MEESIYRCMTKATTAEGEQMKRGVNWALARRGMLKVFEDRLECGDWRIDYSEMRAATLYSFRTLLVIPGFILKVETVERTYHFGLNGGKYWKGELPFAVSRERGKVGHSVGSVLARVVLVLLLGYYLWKKFGA